MIAIADLAAGTVVTITTAKGSVTGTFISINSKGANIKTDDGRVISRSLAAITRVDLVADDTDDEVTADQAFEDEGEYGAADIAAALSIDAYDLRVWLRDRGYGVGKGRKYGFDMGDANGIVRAYKANPVVGPVEA